MPPRRERELGVWLGGSVTLVMLTGFFVRVEPAPYDVLMGILVCVGVLGSWRYLSVHLLWPSMGVAAFMMANLISLAECVDMDAAGRYLAITLYLCATWFGLVALLRRHKHQLAERILTGNVLAVLVAALTGILAYIELMPSSLELMFVGRVRGFFKDVNVFGAFLVPGVVFATLSFATHGRRIVMWLVLLVGGIGVLLSYSRGAAVNLVVALTLLASLRIIGGGRGLAPRIRALAGVCVVAGILGVVFWSVLGQAEIGDMLTQRFRSHEYDGDRFVTQQRSWQMAWSTPLGIGPGQAEMVFIHAPHSLYLRTLVENGFLGFLGFSIFFASALCRSTWTAMFAVSAIDRRLQAAVAASLWGMAVESFVIDTVHWRHLFVFLALAWCPTTGSLPFRGRLLGTKAYFGSAPSLSET